MRKLAIGKKAKEKLTCSNCNKKIAAGKQHTYKGKDGADVYLCATCKVQVIEALEAEQKNINFKRAFLGGFIAATLGALAWFMIALMTGIEAGIVAIGVGYLVVKGITMGSGMRTSKGLQITGVLLTLLAILAANYFLGYFYIHETALKEFPNEDPTLLVTGSLYIAATAFFEYAISPIGLFIWGIGLYIAYMGLKPARI